MQREKNREFIKPRSIKFEPHYIKNALGSCLVSWDETIVLCNASMENRIPRFLKADGKNNSNKGWITAEYSMLPGATSQRNSRDVIKGQVNARAQEIQRLIGRSLRLAVDLNKLGPRQIIIDCDVLQADGGTRVAAICGGYVALYIALKNLYNKKILRYFPIIRHIAAISAGIINKQMLVDLNYLEDNNAEVDANFVFAMVKNEMSLVEVQCSGEKDVFQPRSLMDMISMSAKACKEVIEKQQKVLELI